MCRRADPGAAPAGALLDPQRAAAVRAAALQPAAPLVRGLGHRRLGVGSLELLQESQLAAGIGTAQAQIGAPAKTGTVYTGDLINGKRVVSSLNTSELEPGKKHLLYLQGVQMSTGQHWYVSVIVAKRARPGKRITLTGGVHGDEMRSVHTVQTVMNQLNPGEMQRLYEPGDRSPPIVRRGLLPGSSSAPTVTLPRIDD